MTQLLALSFDGVASPTVRLRSLAVAGAGQPFGFGIAWFPSEHVAALVKDPAVLGPSSLTDFLSEWSRFRSTVFVCHLLGAAKRRIEQDIHPFVRIHAGRSWVMAHNGDLSGDLAARLPLGRDPVFEPIGGTDSEHAFCWLLTRARERGARKLADIGWETLQQWLSELNDLGGANVILSDGEDLVVHHDRDRLNGLAWVRHTPPHGTRRLASHAFDIDLGGALDSNRTAVLFATEPMSDSPWQVMQGGQMLVARRGAIIYDLPPAAGAVAPKTPSQSAPARHEPQVEPGPREVLVSHATTYRYGTPVEVSSHVLRLRPVTDREQQVVEHSLELSPGGLRSDFEDVFGNQVTRLDIDRSYAEMRMVSRSRVRTCPQPPLALNAPFRRHTIPLVWMPWQREMMHPYLLPLELPESQLRELSDYAMSFVDRQRYDLADVVLDLNRTLYRDYAYVPGSTRLETTPFDVYCMRRGVCQDFANLLICLARLLGIPARYRVGYVSRRPAATGAQPTTDDRTGLTGSGASHAWAELYLPWVGWRGFDPTHGVLAGTDHIRVACGRNYRDATPTSGTIYRGGGSETLEVSVQVVTAT